MIKMEFEGPLRGCKFYLYVIIFKEKGVEKSGEKRRKARNKKREKIASQEEQNRDSFEEGP